MIRAPYSSEGCGSTRPQRCPKCQAVAAWIIREEQYAKCLTCGQDAFVASDHVLTLKDYNALLRRRNLSTGMTRRYEEE